jgi:hypothetical protein
MRPSLVLSLALIPALLAPGQAAAFDFGFVRVPDWMGPWILGLAAGMVPFWLFVAVTKPRHIAFRDVRRSHGEVARITRMAHGTMLVLFAALMAMIFVGMGLRRYAEAVAG